MDQRTRTILLWSGVAVLIIAGIVILSLSFGGSNDSATAVEAVYTNAALTLVVQGQTLQASMLSASPSPTSLASPTSTFTSLPSSALQLTPVLLASPTSAIGGAVGCDNSLYISDVTIPDGTAVASGQTFTKTWKVSNTGTCAWTATYQLVFISGDVMNGKASVIGKVVNPGESADISVSLTAPTGAGNATGNITGTWRLSNDKAQPFGTALTVVIKPIAATGTVGTPTSTFTLTTMPIATTTVPTNTTAPVAATAVPTDTTVPTGTPSPTTAP